MRLLVTDSDAGSADVLAESLRRFGHAVRTAYTDRQCLRLVTEFRPHLVVLLLRTPELAKQLRGKSPVISVDHLQQPVDVQAVVRMMRDALAGSGDE